MKKPQPDTTTEDVSDFIWGAKAIGDVINRSPSQTRYLIKSGVLRDCVWKVGHKSLLASRRRLRNITIPTS
jgi:hypothetical protein